ncbi:hypothetical protein [Acrocarpospora sp. B8E8]|uniref:hypothetical protein n=1 Tax=Acrocarpospora sp. B8E8 TaxID=3153572 RepID=UPI00325F1713
MGQSPTAKLIYGYDLDGSSEWKIEEVSEDGELKLSWFSQDWDDEDAEERDFITEAEKRLLASVGFTETDWRADGYFAREKEAAARLGVDFEWYAYEPGAVVLAAKVVEVDWGSIPVDLAALTAEAAASDWDAKLDAACRALDMTPTQERPGWLLCAQYG